MAATDAILKLADDVTFQTLSDQKQSVILSLASGYLYTCNATTAAFLRAVDGRRTLAEITDLLAGQFDVERVKLAADLEAMAQRLIDEGLIRRCEGPPT